MTSSGAEYDAEQGGYGTATETFLVSSETQERLAVRDVSGRPGGGAWLMEVVAYPKAKRLICSASGCRELPADADAAVWGRARAHEVVPSAP